MRKIYYVVVILLFSHLTFAQKAEETKLLKYNLGSSVQIYQTAEGTNDRLSSKGIFNLEENKKFPSDLAVVSIDPSVQFQTLDGFGGALTDAAAETFYKLSTEKQNEIMTAYFDPEKGIGYNFCRTHIHSCDFSSDSYTYIKEGDKELTSFSVAHDKKFRIPFIKQAISTSNNTLKIFASPWSPPAWMKTNNDVLHGGKLKPEFADSWANYYVKFIQAYDKEGIKIWGTTVQNEPAAIQTWESCEFSAEDERDFVKNHLGPIIKKSGLDTKIMVWDHNRDIMFSRAATVLQDPNAAKFVWGVGFHWYVGDHFNNVRLVHDAFPDKNLVFTEGCLYPFNLDSLKLWKWGETYGKSIINDLNNWTIAWTDWNIILDEKGGPNHVQNYCYAPIVADTRTSKVHYMNSYFYMGHFSKFIKRGARRIVSTSTNDDLMTTAAVNPDGSQVVVVMNTTNKPIDYLLEKAGKAIKQQMLPHSIVSIIVK